MSTEENKAMEQRIWEELLNAGKTERMNEFIAIDYVYHGPGGYEIKGIEGLKKFITWLHTSPKISAIGINKSQTGRGPGKTTEVEEYV